MSVRQYNIVVTDCAPIYPRGDGRWNVLADFGKVAVYDRTAADELVERCKDADCILTNKVPVDDAAIAALPGLKYIGILATGYNIVDIAAARRAGVTVTNVPSYSTASVAQHAIALLLAAVNDIAAYSAETAAGHWCKCPDFSYRRNDWLELAGKTFGVVGMGHIGHATANIAAALGMNILAATSKPADSLPAGYEKAAGIDDLFRRADVVSLHCPLTPDTAALVNSTRLALMKRGSIVINTSRGAVVDEQAVAQALKSGQLKAFCADVLSNEPPCSDNPLVGVPGAIITPHIAWASSEARSRLMDTAVDNLRAYVDGKPINVVD